MKKINVALLSCLLMLLVGCRREAHFITDGGYRAAVHHDFEQRVSDYHLTDLNFDTLSLPEREAMEFLYAYMPLSDLADYEPQFFLAQVRTAFAARAEMTWGSKVPEDIFRHFVLVYRVNNENLDTARQLMFRELKERVNGLPMEEAALEVNHWCHEHVAYRASDGRTSAPLATMCTSLGRCGEESTFAVTALRSVGIPARQCYTPRWAHCDDNHAWVEVWVDGQWKHCGACEPDPHLDMGWFDIPSTRCMMVHSKAFGRYHGDEEVVRRTPLFSELNLLCHYAPTRRISAHVVGVDGKAAEDVDVSFCLYNYAEYYPLSVQKTDASGVASLTTGLGDLLVWATDGENYAYGKIDVRTDSVITLALMSTPPDGVVEFEMVPPAAGEAKVTPTAEELATNARRLDYEDSLRNAYVATFHSGSKNHYVRKSEGNWATIEAFLDRHPGREDYLATFSDKDMRDITLATLEAHLTEGSGEVFTKGLLPARISNEMVRPYREELARFIGMSADEIAQWVKDSIIVDEGSNYYNCPVSPVGVMRLRHADRHSRDIFFVAACRAAHIPAYLDGATGLLYAWHDGQWRKASVEVNADGQPSQPDVASASLTITYHGKSPAQPQYYPHYTLAKMDGGCLRTFDFEEDPRMATLPSTLILEPGIYCLSSGNRYADGAVRSRLEFFELKAGQKLTHELVIPQLLPRAEILGVVSPDIELFDGVDLRDYAGANGMLYINLGQYSEPSKHLVVELRDLQDEIRKWGGQTLMVGPSTIGMAGWKLANTDIAYQKGELEKLLLEVLESGEPNYPLVVFINSNGVIRYHSQGYKIGVVEQALKVASN